jgi:hypothetical protein
VGDPATLHEDQARKRLKDMGRGCVMTKYNMGKGMFGSKTDSARMTRRRVALSPSQDEVWWGDTSANKVSNTIAVGDIVNVKFGHDSPVFRSFTFKPHPEWLCFSIVTAERTVSFACQSDDDLATWVCGLGALIRQPLPFGHLLWRRLEMHMKDELHNQGFTGVVTRLGEGLARQQARGDSPDPPSSTGVTPEVSRHPRGTPTPGLQPTPEGDEGGEGLAEPSYATAAAAAALADPQVAALAASVDADAAAAGADAQDSLAEPSYATAATAAAFADPDIAALAASCDAAAAAPAAPPAAPVTEETSSETRFVTVPVPVAGGKKGTSFKWTVDNVERTFTAPPLAKKGTKHEFSFVVRPGE